LTDFGSSRRLTVAIVEDRPRQVQHARVPNAAQNRFSKLARRSKRDAAPSGWDMFRFLLANPASNQRSDLVQRSRGVLDLVQTDETHSLRIACFRTVS
jgi:hypothetical protein